MVKLFLIFSILVFFCIAYSDAKAQNENTNCGWKLLNNGFRLSKKASVPFQKDQVQSTQVTDTAAIFTLPVVVHAIHTGDAIGSPQITLPMLRSMQ